MSYIKEQQEWDARVAEWLGPEARLISVSRHSSDIRVYRSLDTVTKLRRFSPATVFDRPSTLEDEYLILSWMHEKPSNLPVPVPKGYRRNGEWEMMSMAFMDAPVVQDPVANPTIEKFGDVWAVARLVWRLNQLGVSHGDLVRSNAGTFSRGTLVMLDFDQAVIGSPLKCFLRDFIGFQMHGRASQYSLFERFGEARGFRGISRALNSVRRRFQKNNNERLSGPLSLGNRCKASGDAQLMELAEIWKKASQSGANSPGGGVAYYSLDIAGIHFPGERPWALRWDMIRRAVNFRGKRLVELGCNLGLLSIHARLAGASEVVGADHNAQIVESAQKLNSIFYTDGKFYRTDFDNDADWECVLGDGDIVTALSLTYWLRNNDRLWKYLARFREVIFEGHESAEEIEARFLRAGFSHINRIGVSERNRVVFHAVR